MVICRLTLEMLCTLKSMTEERRWQLDRGKNIKMRDTLRSDIWVSMITNCLQKSGTKVSSPHQHHHTITEPLTYQKTQMQSNLTEAGIIRTGTLLEESGKEKTSNTKGRNSLETPRPSESTRTRLKRRQKPKAKTDSKGKACRAGSHITTWQTTKATGWPKYNQVNQSTSHRCGKRGRRSVHGCW